MNGTFQRVYARPETQFDPAKDRMERRSEYNDFVATRDGGDVVDDGDQPVGGREHGRKD